MVDSVYMTLLYHVCKLHVEFGRGEVRSQMLSHRPILIFVPCALDKYHPLECL